MPRKIIPSLIAPVSLGQVESAFNPPVEQKIVTGSEAWYKKKEANSGKYIQDLIYRIQTGQGSYGKSKYKKDYAVDEMVIDKRPRKSKFKKGDEPDMKHIDTPNPSSADEKKERIKKWKQLFKDNQFIDKQKGSVPVKKASAQKKSPPTTEVVKNVQRKAPTAKSSSTQKPPSNELCPQGHTYVKAHCRKNYVKKKIKQ
jgi:hypothetical protein